MRALALVLSALVCGCVSAQPQHFPLLPVSAVEPSKPVSLRVIDRRIEMPAEQRVEAITGDEITVVVQNRIEAELARHGLARGEGEGMTIEIVDFT